MFQLRSGQVIKDNDTLGVFLGIIVNRNKFEGLFFTRLSDIFLYNHSIQILNELDNLEVTPNILNIRNFMETFQEKDTVLYKLIDNGHDIYKIKDCKLVKGLTVYAREEIKGFVKDYRLCMYINSKKYYIRKEDLKDVLYSKK